MMSVNGEKGIKPACYSGGADNGVSVQQCRLIVNEPPSKKGMGLRLLPAQKGQAGKDRRNRQIGAGQPLDVAFIRSKVSTLS